MIDKAAMILRMVSPFILDSKAREASRSVDAQSRKLEFVEVKSKRIVNTYAANSALQNRSPLGL